MYILSRAVIYVDEFIGHLLNFLFAFSRGKNFKATYVRYVHMSFTGHNLVNRDTIFFSIHKGYCIAIFRFFTTFALDQTFSRGCRCAARSPSGEFRGPHMHWMPWRITVQGSTNCLPLAISFFVHWPTWYRRLSTVQE